MSWQDAMNTRYAFLNTYAVNNKMEGRLYMKIDIRDIC
jgi:hypothetical protein